MIIIRSKIKISRNRRTNTDNVLPFKFDIRSVYMLKPTTRNWLYWMLICYVLRFLQFARHRHAGFGIMLS